MSISVGNKVELVKLDQIIRNEPNKKVYVSKIFDIQPGRILQIAMPIYEGKIVPLNLDEKYSACFYTEKGLLQCNVVVKARYKSGNLFFLDVFMITEISKVQRRAFYRYNCLLDAKIRIVSDNEFTTGIPDNIDIPSDNLNWSDVKIVDISGGGARLVAKEHLEKNEVIKLKFMVLVLDEVMYFDLFARVLSSVQTRERRGLYEQRLEFMKISQDDRDKIIRYIFESERLARAKEAGK